MIITILWEDRRGGQVKGFGPHELLIACLVDDEAGDRDSIKSQIISQARKGNGGVLRMLTGELQSLADDGPVFAVFDSDKAHEMWRPPAPSCKSGFIEYLNKEAPGEYTTVLLVENMESLLGAISEVVKGRPLGSKPNPNARDRLIQQAVWGASQAERTKIRQLCPSLDRLVLKVAAKLREAGS